MRTSLFLVPESSQRTITSSDGSVTRLVDQRAAIPVQTAVGVAGRWKPLDPSDERVVPVEPEYKIHWAVQPLNRAQRRRQKKK